MDKSEREKIKNMAVGLREAGNLQEALKMFREVEEWDIKNDNVRGHMDVLGHMRITFTRLAEEEKDPKRKKNLYHKALEVAQEAIRLGESNKDTAGDPTIIQQVHLASAILDTIKTDKNDEEKRKKLAQALSLVNHAIENLPGSQAHKAWPATLKAKIEYEMGSIDDSLHTLIQAQEWVIKGYGDEVAKDDQAIMKLNVWLSGLMLTTADICAKENKPFLAKHYAIYVMTMADPENLLGERKKEAKRILDSLEK